MQKRVGSGASAVVLSPRPDWNRRLRNTYRDRWARVGGRHFKVYATSRYGLWNVEEVDENGRALTVGYYGVAFTLEEARALIAAATTR